MKVCYVTHKPNLTGANRSLLDMLDGFDRSIVEPVVLVNRPGPLLKELRNRNVQYKFALLWPTLNSDKPFLNVAKKLLNSAAINRLGVISVKRALKKIKPDLVHNNSMLVSVGMQAADELHIPYICHFRDFLWEDHHRKLLRPKRMHKLISHADECISISNAVKDKFQAFSKKPVVVIQDGIHTENYVLPERKVLQNPQVHLILAGRINEGKGQLDAVKAFEIASASCEKELVLHLVGGVGDQKYYENLSNYIADRHLKNVHMEPFVSDLRKLRGSCDIGLTCSLSEGLGRVTIENMLSSLLVIASDSAGTLEIVEDGVNGLLYRTGSCEALAEKILWAVHHFEEVQPLVRQGRQFALSTYDCQVYSNKILEVYHSVLNS